jgi:hypothetical protein
MKKERKSSGKLDQQPLATKQIMLIIVNQRIIKPSLFGQSHN